MTASAVSHRSVQGSNGFAEEKRGTWLKDAGAAPTVIQHQLGHADPRLAFELYVMSIPGERRKAVERVSTQLKRLLDPNSTHRSAMSEERGSNSAAVSAG